MNVQIPSELGPFVHEKISQGDYRDENELLIAGLRLLRAQDQLRMDVVAGIEQLDDGQGLEGEEVFARLAERGRL